MPTHAEDYVHRIGRTGRAGLRGTAITIATSLDRKYVAGIEKMMGQPIPPLAVEAAAERAAAVYGHHRDKPSEGRPSEGRGRGERRERGGRHRRNGAAPRARTGSAAGARSGAASTGTGRGGGARVPSRATVATITSRHRRSERPHREPPTRSAERPREQERPARKHEPREREDQAVVGLGDHVPSFLLRRTRTPTA